PASVTITQLEPVVFLRGQSASGQDARGRHQIVNIDAPPSQLRALVTVSLPKPSKIKEISVSLTGTARTDWPEGIGPNRLETVEEVTIFKQLLTLYNAKHEDAESNRPRRNSVGPGIGLQDDIDWDYAAAAHASSSSSRTPVATPRGHDQRSTSAGGANGSNLARQIAGAAAKAGTAIIPPTLRPDIGLVRPKDSTPSRSNRPPLQRTGSGTSSWANSAASPDSRISSPAQSPSARFQGSASVSPSARSGADAFAEAFGRTRLSPSASLADLSLHDQESRGRLRSPPQDLSQWHDYFESQGHERPPLYAPRSAPLQGYDSWPTEPMSADGTVSSSENTEASVAASASSSTARLTSQSAESASAEPGSRTGSTLEATRTAHSAAPAKSILHNQPAAGACSRSRDHSVRFDPQSRVDEAASGSTSSVNGRSASRSAPNSRRNSMEIVDKNKPAAKQRSSTKAATDTGNKTKKPGFKNLIHTLLKEPDTTKGHGDEAASVGPSDSKEFKKGTYTYPICISLPSNLPPTLHADFGFNRYVLKVNVVRAGALTPNLLAEREIKLVHAPDEDALEETGSIVVERCWEDVLSYMVVFSGKSFPIGQRIPLWLKFIPLGKVKIHRIIATLEERTDYFAKGRRVARHEVPRKWTLLKLAHTKGNEPILPIMSDSANALDESPVGPLARLAADDDMDSDVLTSILDPTGPWELATDLMIPASGTTRINMSTNHDRSNIAVHHLVRLAIRVEKPEGVYGDGSSSSPSSGKDHKMYDIVIEAPITLTSAHTAVEWTSLPNYWNLPDEPSESVAARSPVSDGGAMSTGTARQSVPVPVLTSRTGLVGSRAAAGTTSPPGMRSPSAHASGSAPMSRNPTQSSRQWLALSAENVARDGTGSSSAGMRPGREAPPPPAYQPNARNGETTVASTSMNRSAS
ncbi:hypothetical protein BCV70DRAFT_149779, partial [Testicularia cyperi]